MEGKNVHVLTIGPGMVHTPGSEAGIAVLAPLYHKSEEEFFAMSKDVTLTPEQAGAGFAAAVVLAERFRGQEISSFAALSAVGITAGPRSEARGTLTELQWLEAETLAGRAISDLDAQYKGWMDMVVFKRQWILRDFKKGAGMPVEQWLESLRALHAAISARDVSKIVLQSLPFDRLAAQYGHMLEMLVDYEKDPLKLNAGENAIKSWIRDVESLRAILSSLRPDR